MSAQVRSTDILGEIPNMSDDPKDTLQKLNLSRMEEWEPHLEQDAWILKNSSNLWNSTLVLVED